jgi:phage terminase large subunit-like protein
LFPPQDGLETWYAIFEAWVPAENMKKRVLQDKVPYDRWVNEKFLHATPGNAVDYDFVQATIEQAAAKYDMVLLATDPWNSRMLTQQLMKKDIEVIEVSQTMGGLSPAMKHIEKLLLTDDLLHEKNPLDRWCFGNLNIAVDGNENIKPMKNKSTERIDVIVSLINAMAIAMGHEMESIYESRGMLVI